MKSAKTGLAKDSPPFFTDLPINKTNLAKELGIARSTLYLWSRIAYFRVPGFKEAYPIKANGMIDKQAPLSPYQCWVISLIGRLFKIYETSERVAQYISKNPDDFSIYKFKAAIAKMY
jgi:hypothetical protein